MADPKQVLSLLVFLMLYTINIAYCDFFVPSVAMSPAPLDASSPISSPSSSYGYYAPAPSSPPYPESPNYSPSYPVAPSHHGIPASPVVPATPASPSYPVAPSSRHSAPVPPVYPVTPASPFYPLVPSPHAVPVSPSYPGAPTSPAYPSVPASPEAAPPPPCPSPQPVFYDQAIKAAYWPAFNELDPSAIDTTYFTHIYYAFLLLDPVTFTLTVAPSDQEKITGFIANLRARNPPVKILLSIGGANINQTKYFSIMSSTRKRREDFINSTIEVATTYGFDGLDLDWESPADDEEMTNLALLLSEWRNALDLEAETTGKPRILLSAAVYYSSRFNTYGEPRSYPAQAINDFLDWINPMCYDYHGSWDNFTGPISALYDPNGNLSTSYGIGSWMDSGVLPQKIVMGLPLYGPTWTLQDPNSNGIGAKAVGVGPGNGILTYSQIMEFNKNNRGEVHFDGESVSYYSVSGNYWVGYDDIISVEWKIRFARARGLRGYFFWAYGMDLNSTISTLASKSWDRP